MWIKGFTQYPKPETAKEKHLKIYTDAMTFSKQCYLR